MTITVGYLNVIMIDLHVPCKAACADKREKLLYHSTMVKTDMIRGESSQVHPYNFKGP
jgi:hypothetical protein